jgi:hypothetical protein
VHVQYLFICFQSSFLYNIKHNIFRSILFRTFQLDSFFFNNKVRIFANFSIQFSNKSFFSFGFASLWIILCQNLKNKSMFKINRLLDSHSASWLEQEYVARHVAPLIIPVNQPSYYLMLCVFQSTSLCSYYLMLCVFQSTSLCSYYLMLCVFQSTSPLIT